VTQYKPKTGPCLENYCRWQRLVHKYFTAAVSELRSSWQQRKWKKKRF